MNNCYANENQNTMNRKRKRDSFQKIEQNINYQNEKKSCSPFEKPLLRNNDETNNEYFEEVVECFNPIPSQAPVDYLKIRNPNYKKLKKVIEKDDKKDSMEIDVEEDKDSLSDDDGDSDWNDTIKSVWNDIKIHEGMFCGGIDKSRIENLDLPIEMSKIYQKKYEKGLWPWQVACLDDVKNLDGSFVYTVPTGGGKTLISEILMARELMKKPSKKILYVVPFVAIVKEKEDDLQNKFDTSGFFVGKSFSNKSRSNFDEEMSIVVCTIERGNSIVNKLVEKNELSQISMVVIDEIHMINDQNRGSSLELLITKIMFCQSDIKIIGMSATIPDLRILCEWLDARLFYTNWRPIELREYIYKAKERKLYDSEINLVKEYPENDEKGILPIISEVISKNKSVLIFCNNRFNTSFYAKMIFDALPIEKDILLPVEREKRLINPLKEHYKSCAMNHNKELLQYLEKGIAFHHAGLTKEERRIIEIGYSSEDKLVNILTCTTTLSVGVNLPAQRVIFTSLKIGRGEIGKTRYKQACGRAGRFGKDEIGESVIFCDNQERNININAEKLISDNEEFCSDSNSGLTFRKKNKNGEKVTVREGLNLAVLEAICSGICKSESDLGLYLEKTFLFKLKDISKINVVKELEFSLNFLCNEKNNLVELKSKEYEFTKLGYAIYKSGFTIAEGLTIFKDLRNARKNLNISFDLHLLYLVSPIRKSISLYQKNMRIFFLEYKKLQNGKIGKDHRKLLKRIGIVDDYFINYEFPNSNYNKNEKQDQLLYRLFLACILSDVINEDSTRLITKKWQVYAGQIQGLQYKACSLAKRIELFCDNLNWKNMKSLIRNFRKRLNFGVKEELLNLVEVEGVSSIYAREMYKNGIKTVDDILSTSEMDLHNYLVKVLPYHNEKKLKKRKTVNENFLIKSRIILENAKRRKIEIEELERIKRNFSSPPNTPRYVTPNGINGRSPLSESHRWKSPVSSNMSSSWNADPPNQFARVNIKNKENIPFPCYKIENLEQLKDFIRDIKKKRIDVLSFKFILRGQDSIVNTTPIKHLEKGDLVGLAFYFCKKKEHKCYHIILESARVNEYLMILKKEIFENEKIKKISWDIKRELNILLFFGIELYMSNTSVIKKYVPFHDPLIMYWMFKNHSLETRDRTVNYISISKGIKELKLKIGINFEERNINFVTKTIVTTYQSYHVAKELRLLMKERKIYKLYKHVELKVCVILSELQFIGIGYSKQSQENNYEFMDKAEKLLKEKANRIFGEKINLNGTSEEVHRGLFEILKLKPPSLRGKKTMNKEELLETDRINPNSRGIGRIIVEYRSCATRKLDYKGKGNSFHFKFCNITNMNRRIDFWSQSQCSTGRIHSGLQNISKDFKLTKLDIGKLFGKISGRKMFVAKSGYVFLSFDFSQIEARLLAHLSEDEKLIKFFEEGDVFRKVASEIYTCKESEVDEEKRSIVKELFYACIYGMTPKRVHEKIRKLNFDMSEDDSRKIFNNFFKKFRGVDEYINLIKKQARQKSER